MSITAIHRIAGVDFICAAYGYGKSVDGYVAKVHDIRQLNDVIE